MEHQIAHRAADTITKLLKAHIDESASDVDIHQAVAVRDDIRELAREIESDNYQIPEVGDTMYDGRCPVDIVEVTDYTADIYHIDGKEDVAVSEYKNNRQHDPKSPIVKVTYPGTEKKYALPLDRLDWNQD